MAALLLFISHCAGDVAMPRARHNASKCGAAPTTAVQCLWAAPACWGTLAPRLGMLRWASWIMLLALHRLSFEPDVQQVDGLPELLLLLPHRRSLTIMHVTTKTNRN